jgi:hypothetical protein
MELLPCSAIAKLRCGSGDVGLHRHLCPHWAGGQPVLPPLGIQPTGRVAERMLLPEERRRRATPCYYG